ncbi:MAG: DinB family protein [Actinomycetota bacterium]
MYPELISKGFRRNQRVVVQHAEGLTDADALRQSGFNTNCFNWVVGHMVANRLHILDALGADRTLSIDMGRYVQESDPIKEAGPGVLSLGDLLAALDETEVRIEKALAAADEAFMAEETPIADGRTATRAARVMFLYFHDIYHAGQTDVIRQLSGKSDKII